MKIDIEKLLVYIADQKSVAAISDKFIDINNERALYKISCRLTHENMNLQIKWLIVFDELNYAYQLYSDTALMRWDNAPHHPSIVSFPHHFHTIENTITESELKGIVFDDLEIVFNYIDNYFQNKNMQNLL